MRLSPDADAGPLARNDLVALVEAVREANPTHRVPDVRSGPVAAGRRGHLRALRSPE